MGIWREIFPGTFENNLNCASLRALIILLGHLGGVEQNLCVKFARPVESKISAEDQHHVIITYTHAVFLHEACRKMTFLGAHYSLRTSLLFLTLPLLSTKLPFS